MRPFTDASRALDRHVRASLDPSAPTSLFDADALRDVRAVAGLLPADLTDFFGFETRLADARPAVDFLICVKTPEGRRALAALPEQEKPAGVWHDLTTFGRHWTAPASPLADTVTNAWLEFDLPAAQPEDGVPPDPSLFIGSASVFGGQRAPDWLVDVALPLCRGRALSGALRASLDRTLALVPPTAHAFQFGSMRARPGFDDALRVCLRGVDRAAAAPLLAGIGWTGAAEEADAALAFAAPWAIGVDIDVDLLPATGPKLGLECSFGFGPDARGRLTGFLDALVARGLCLPAKRDGLLAWERGFHQRADPQGWPAELVRQAAERPEPTVSMLLRWVYHVKLVVQPGQPWEAKAYLAVAQHWMTGAQMAHVKAAQVQVPSSGA